MRTLLTTDWMQRRALTLLLAAACLLPGLANADTLLEVYKLALENDPRFRSAQAEYLATGTALEQAQAGFLPTVRFEAERTNSRQRIFSSSNPIFGTGQSTFPIDNKTLNITQPLFRKDVIERLLQARAVVQQSEYLRLAAEQDLQLRTTAAYLIVLAASDSVALARAEREAVGKALDLARERLRMGLGTIVNQHDAAARYAVTQARELEAQNRLRDAQQGLREITGRLIDNVQVLRDEFPLEVPEPTSIDSWVDTAMEQNLALRAKRVAVEVARQEIDRQRAAHFPSLNLVLNRNRRESGSTLFGGGSDVETTDLTLRLSVPIFEGGLVTAVTREATFRHRKAQEDLEVDRRALDRLTRAAYDGVVGGVTLVQALRQSVVSQESALQGKQEAFRSGILTLLPVLDAQRDLYLALRDLAQSRYDYLINRLRLKQAAGTLSEADLVTVSAAMR
jgi:outer membrane protein